MKNILLLVILVFLFYPPQIGSTQPIKPAQNVPIETLKQENKELNKQLKEAVLKPTENPKVKIIYRNRTKIVQHKPKEIIIYVRHIDSTITEHKVRADGGFYIVNEADITTPEYEVKIEIKDDTFKKINFWKRIWNK